MILTEVLKIFHILLHNLSLGESMVSLIWLETCLSLIERDILWLTKGMGGLVEWPIVVSILLLSWCKVAM
jgi:hypothetical protein